MEHRRCRVFLACICTVLAVSCTTYELNPPDRPASAADRAQVFDPQEIVALVQGAGAAAALRSGAEAEGFVFRERASLEALDLEMLRFAFPATLDGAGAIAALERIEPRSTAGVNHAYRIARAAGANRFDYARRLMGWSAGSCPARSTVGMLDTGVDSDALQGSGATVITASFARGGRVDQQHGTDVASVLVDSRHLQGVTLYSAAVVGRSDRGEEEAGVDAILKAIDWMVDHDVRVVNVSLAGPYNKLLDRGIDRATTLGLTIVAAVGNDGRSSAPRYPAAFDAVIAVTAVDAEGAVFRDAVQGPFVDVAAPGVDILVPNQARTRFATGTSMAVPFVTARIAADPALFGAPTARIKARLAATAQDLGAPGKDAIFGAGLVTAPLNCRH